MGTIVKNGELYYCGEQGCEGMYYKDWDAWNNNDNTKPIYLSEAELMDGEIDAWMISDKDLKVRNDFWTREKWIDWVLDWLPEGYKTKEFAEYIAEGILYEAEWACLSTYLHEWSDDDIRENWEYFNLHK